HDLIEEAPHLDWWLAHANRRTDLRAVAAITRGEFHDHDVAILERAPGGPRIAEDQRRIFHGGRADDREVEISSPFENGAGGSGFELIFRHTGPAASCQSLHRRLTELTRFADAIEFLGALAVNQFMHPTRLKAESSVRQRLRERHILIHGHVVVKARVHFQDTDLTLIKPQLFDPLDDHLGKAAAARLAHIFDSALLSSRLDVRTAPRGNKGGATAHG